LQAGTATWPTRLTKDVATLFGIELNTPFSGGFASGHAWNCAAD
jgi:hypothetical protein